MSQKGNKTVKLRHPKKESEIINLRERESNTKEKKKNLPTLCYNALHSSSFGSCKSNGTVFYHNTTVNDKETC